MSLQNLVASRLNMTDADIATELNAATVPRTDATRYTWAGLALRFGTSTVAAMRAALIAVPNVGPLVDSILTSSGVDFSLDETQAMLDSLSGVFDAQSTAALKSIGRWNVSPYVADGGTGNVTTEQIAVARENIAIEAVRSKLATALNEVIWPLVSAGGSWADVQAAIAGIE